MRGRLLAIAFAAASMPGWVQADPVDGTETRPTWIERPTGEMVAKFYPPAAINQRVSGVVTLECAVLVDGRARCSVARETPLGWGFGDAALSLSRAYRFSPATRAGAPVESTYTLRIPFSLETEAAEKARLGPPGESSPNALDLPSWIEAPSAERVATLTPASLAAGARGRGVLGCLVNPDRTLSCNVLGESPAGAGLGAAALELSQLFRVARAETRFIAQYRDKRFTLPINFGFPAAQEPVGVYAGLSPVVMPSPTSEFVDRYYPRAARRAGVLGEAVVACTLKVDRTFECLAESETPVAQGFGAAAVQMFDDLPAEFWEFLQNDVGLIEGDRVRTVVPFTLY